MLTLLATLVIAQQPAIPTGTHIVTADIEGTAIELYTYKPKEFRDGPIVMVFHGVLRNADVYRDNAIELGDRLQALIVAPKFDNERFPTSRYQFGGILSANREPNPPGQWTYAMIPKIVDEVRRREGRPDAPYFLIGHSAGGQFLVRMAAFTQVGAQRVVAANPGSHLFPSRDLPFPYGFGNLPETLSSDAVIKAYLAQPLTIYVGTADNGPDQYFDSSENAMKQGPGRYQRGKAAFKLGQTVAEENGWPFNWRLVEAPDVAHDNKKMWNAPTMAEALKP
jgi:poly(3-hydroxybutyrate) depolymerase